MHREWTSHFRWLYAFSLLLLVAACGCRGLPHHEPAPNVQAPLPSHHMMPRELSKVVLPAYTIEPPDILLIDAILVVPKAPYRLRTFDALMIRVQGTLPDAPIDGVFRVESGGVVVLGFPYGSVKVDGLTLEEAKKATEEALKSQLAEPVVTMSLADTVAKQQITGEHLVGPDGTVTMGSYGSVSVVGKTISQAKTAIEEHLSQYLDNPEVSVDVFAYNSKVYYVITQGAGFGDSVYRFPVTGNETVLDAVSQLNGLDQVSSKNIWIARPTGEDGSVQVLPVDWNAITAQASTSSNYQILPGDRVFVEEDKLIAFDTNLGKLVAPFERIMGFTLLGAGTASRLSGRVLQGGGNQRQGGF